MQYRATRLVMLSTTSAALFALGMRPPEWSVPPAAIQPPQAAICQPARLPEIPQIVAVDERIARRVNALRPCIKQRLVRVTRKLPKKVTLLVTSAFRTREEQASLRSTFGVKARPGMSTHEDGRAIDVNVLVDGERVSPRRQNKIIGQAMSSEGFRYLGPADPVHYSVPKDQVDQTLLAGPDLQVMTWSEMQDLQELHKTAAQPPSLPGVLMGPVLPTQSGS
jgi:hypothetical protein